MKVSTYIDNSEGVDLSPSDNLVDLFKAWLDHGPGHSEDLIFSVDATGCSLSLLCHKVVAANHGV